MPLENLYHFHGRLKVKSAENGLKSRDSFIKDVARSVKDYFPNIKIDLNKRGKLWTKFSKLLSDIAEGDDNLLEMLNKKKETLREDFKTSLTFYSFNENLELSLHAATDAFKDNLTYKILNRKVKTIIPKFHDMDDDSMGKFEDLFHSRLQRQYGAVLKLNSVERELLFFSCISKGSGAQMVKMDPEFPPFEIQKFEDNEHEEDEKERFKLLKWLSHMENVENFDIDTFPANYLADILTMSCMFMNNAVKLKELDLMLWTVFAYHEKIIIPRESDVKGEEYICDRAFRIPHTFAEIYQKIQCSIDICKLRERCWVNYY